MELSQITDMTALKAMAYDQIAAKEQAENNLRLINQRLQQIMNGEADQPQLPLDAETTTTTTTVSE